MKSIKKEYIRTHKLTKEISDNKLFEDVNVSFYMEEIVGIVGDEASGIDALIDVISGKSGVPEGKLYCNMERVDSWNEREAEKYGIIRIHPKSQLLCGFSIAENLCLIRKNCKVPRSEKYWIHQRNIAILTQEYLADWEWDIDSKEKAEYLSLVEQLRLLIIRADMCQCKMLILDHVCHAAFEENYPMLISILNKLKQKGIGVIVIESHPDLIEHCADRILIFRQGQMVADYYNDEFDLETIRINLRGKWNEQSNEFRNSLKTKRQIELKGDKAIIRIEAGEIIGFDAKQWDWKKVRDYFNRISIDGKSYNEKIIVLLGEDYNFGLHENWQVYENFCQFDWKRITNRFGWVSKRVMRYAFTESMSDLNEVVEPDKVLEQLSTKEKIDIAFGGILKRNPRILLMAEFGHNMDSVHLELLIKRIVNLSESGITVVLLNPPFSIVRHCCDRLLIWKNSRISREFKKDEIQNDILSKYYYESNGI